VLLVAEDTDTSTVPTVATATPGNTVTQTEISGTSTVPTVATASSVTVPEDTGTTTAGAVVTITAGTTVTIAEDTATATAGILAITTIPVVECLLRLHSQTQQVNRGLCYCRNEFNRGPESSGKTPKQHRMAHDIRRMTVQRDESSAAAETCSVTGCCHAVLMADCSTDSSTL